ncbi:hypothetical protein ABW19_dt0204398 [Dactylella cylindrospora]|nr:hypothetical protein ABW19_dt0204398 [Dactylella cylindrospora]
MCYFDIWVFRDCPCRQWGNLARICDQAHNVPFGEACPNKVESFNEEIVLGKCDRCQEVEAITEELEKGGQKLAQVLADRQKSALEEVNSAVINVYDEILNQRRERRNSRYNKEDENKSPNHSTHEWYYSQAHLDLSPDQPTPKSDHSVFKGRAREYFEATPPWQYIDTTDSGCDISPILPKPSPKYTFNVEYPEPCFDCRLAGSQVSRAATFQTLTEWLTDDTSLFKCMRSSYTMDLTCQRCAEGNTQCSKLQLAHPSFSRPSFGSTTPLSQTRGVSHYLSYGDGKYEKVSHKQETNVQTSSHPSRPQLPKLDCNLGPTWSRLEAPFTPEYPEDDESSELQGACELDGGASFDAGAFGFGGEGFWVIADPFDDMNVSRSYVEKEQFIAEKPVHAAVAAEPSTTNSEEPTLEPIMLSCTDLDDAKLSPTFIAPCKEIPSPNPNDLSKGAVEEEKSCGSANLSSIQVTPEAFRIFTTHAKGFWNGLQMHKKEDEFIQRDCRLCARRGRRWCGSRGEWDLHQKKCHRRFSCPFCPWRGVDLSTHVGQEHAQCQYCLWEGDGAGMLAHFAREHSELQQSACSGNREQKPSKQVPSELNGEILSNESDEKHESHYLERLLEQLWIADVQQSRDRLHNINNNFLEAAKRAYAKLKSAAYSERVSKSFRRFYRDLGDFDEIIKTGCDTLEKFFQGTIPRSLKNMYSFLHVAYAMSQSHSPSTRQLDEFAFRSGIAIFKGCLPSEAESTDELSAQDLFDEIVSIMWDELNSGLAWIKKQDPQAHAAFAGPTSNGNTHQQLKDILKWSSDQGSVSKPHTPRGQDLVIPVSGMASPKISDKRVSSPPPTWRDLMSGKVFTQIIRFLTSLDEVGLVFFYLCGTYCSTISSVATGVLGSKSNCQRRSPNNEPLSPREIEVQDHMDDHIITPFKEERGSGIDKVVATAKYMLRAGPLTNVMDFEGYLIGLVKVHKRSKEEFVRLVKTILSLCQRCYGALPERCKRPNQIQYSHAYVNLRVKEEECWYMSEEVEWIEVASPKAILSHSGRLSVKLQRDDSISPISPIGPAWSALTTQDGQIKTTLTGVLGPYEASAPSSSSASSPSSISTTPSVCLSSSKKRSFPSTPETLTPATSSTFSPFINPLKPTKKRKLAPENKPYACEVPGCSHRDTTEANLKRHQISEHGDAKIKNMVCSCDFPGCNAQRTGARARENIKTHKKQVHGIKNRKVKG